MLGWGEGDLDVEYALLPLEGVDDGELKELAEGLLFAALRIRDGTDESSRAHTHVSDYKTTMTDAG
jgi:hypothetical protein